MADQIEISVLLMKHRARLLGFILAAVRDHHDAEDIWQEVCLVACRKADQFQSGTNFIGWVRTISAYTIKSFRRRDGRSLAVDPAYLDVLIEAARHREADQSDRVDALNHCVDGLPAHQRKMLDLRYQEDLAVKDIAAQLNKKADAVYKALMRLRLALQDCVRRRLANPV